MRSVLGRLGMTQRAFARRIGTNQRTVRGWLAQVDGPVPAAIAHLLLLELGERRRLCDEQAEPASDRP